MTRLKILLCLVVCVLLIAAVADRPSAPPATPTLRVPGAVPMMVSQALLSRMRVEHDSAAACIERAGYGPTWRDVLRNLWVAGAPHRSFGQIQWYVVPGQNFRVPGDTVNKGYLLGLWVPPDTIYMSAAWLSSWVPKHEMIHDLLQRDHWDGDTVVWGRACHAMWGYLGGAS